MSFKDLQELDVQKDLDQRCFFNISVERLLFENKPALNYHQIIKDEEAEPRKFLGIRRHDNQIRNVEAFKYGTDACWKLVNKSPMLFHAGVNEEENVFHAILIGAELDEVLSYQLDQFRKQASRSATMTDLLSKSTLKKYDIEADEYCFKEFFHKKLHSYFFLVRVRNGYDHGKRTGANFSIGKVIDAHQMNIITIAYSDNLNSLFGSGFKYSLYDFIAFYYKMYTISIDGPERLKAIFFDFSDIQLPTNIMGNERSFDERVRRLNQELDTFLEAQPEYNYALLIDYFLRDVEVSSRHEGEEDWMHIKNSFSGHHRIQKFKDLASTIIDNVKRADYEERVMNRYQEIKSFFESVRL